MKLVITSDHAGFTMKNQLADYLKSKGHDVTDLGVHNEDSVDFPDKAKELGTAMQEGKAQRGVMICGSGVGASIALNKMKGIRAGLCHDTYAAHQGVEHDDMNVLCLGGRIIGIELAKELVDAFLSAEFIQDERFIRRLNKVIAMEKG